MSIHDDYSDAIKLRMKQETLRSDYDRFFTNFDLGLALQTELASDELADFETMSRWHKNSHILEDEWMKAFDSIAVNLDVEERMTTLGDNFQQFMRYICVVFNIFKSRISGKSSLVPQVHFWGDSQ